MGEWHHPDHYTDRAKAFAIAERAAEIAVFVENALPALAAACKAETGWGHLAHDDLTPKPHGRAATTITASFGFYIDLSIMPRMEAQSSCSNG